MTPSAHQLALERWQAAIARPRAERKGLAGTSREALQERPFKPARAAMTAAALAAILPIGWILAQLIGQGMDREAALEEARLAAHQESLVQEEAAERGLPVWQVRAELAAQAEEARAAVEKARQIR